MPPGVVLFQRIQKAAAELPSLSKQVRRNSEKLTKSLGLACDKLTDKLALNVTDALVADFGRKATKLVRTDSARDFLRAEIEHTAKMICAGVSASVMDMLQVG
jgi:hypothetical protein